MRAWRRGLGATLTGLVLLVVGLLVATTAPRNRIAGALGALLMRVCDPLGFGRAREAWPGVPPGLDADQ